MKVTTDINQVLIEQGDVLYKYLEQFFFDTDELRGSNTSNESTTRRCKKGAAKSREPHADVLKTGRAQTASTGQQSTSARKDCTMRTPATTSTERERAFPLVCQRSVVFTSSAHTCTVGRKNSHSSQGSLPCEIR